MRDRFVTLVRALPIWGAAGAIVMSILVTGANLFVATPESPAFPNRAEFSPLDQLLTEDPLASPEYFGAAILMELLQTQRFECVPPGSEVFQMLDEHREVAGLSFSTRCSPPEFSVEDAKEVSPQLEVGEIPGTSVYYAVLPDEVSTSDAAIVTVDGELGLVVMGQETLERLIPATAQGGSDVG